MSQFAEPADKTPQLCTQASSTSTSIIFTTSTTTTLLSSLDYRDEFSTSAVGMYQQAQNQYVMQKDSNYFLLQIKLKTKEKQD